MPINANRCIKRNSISDCLFHCLFRIPVILGQDLLPERQDESFIVRRLELDDAYAVLQ